MTDYTDHIDNLVETVHSINLNKVTILTGGNGSGKSMVRKQMVFTTKEAGMRLASTSLESRTTSKAELGEWAGVNRDLGWLPSSVATLDQIDGVLTLPGVSVDAFAVIDEPELGMGEETVMALVEFLNELISNRPANIKGVLVITHNRYVVEHLKHDEFYNLNGYETAQQWLNRPLVPTNIATLRENALFTAFQNRGKEREV